jgi:protein involved in polysaccharide export with SLBB domain
MTVENVTNPCRVHIQPKYARKSSNGLRLCKLIGLILLASVPFSRTGRAQDPLDNTGNPLVPQSDLNSPYGNSDYNPTSDSSLMNLQNRPPAVSPLGPPELGVPAANSQSQDYESAHRRAMQLEAEQLQSLRQLPPDPPTEFQKMVSTSVGKMLPIYGARLFRNLPSTFSPLDRVPVPNSYVIGPGDELLIQLWGQITLNSRFEVDRSGNIYIPQVGTIRVAGLSFAQLHDFLKSQIGRVFRNFDLNVNMGELRSIQVFVVGQARRPGSYTVSSLSTLVDALFATGGPTPQGSMRHIQLKRGSQVVADFDLYDLLLRGDKSLDPPLLDGDVIYIAPVGPQVAVAGSVGSPAIYELKGNGTMKDILDLAAGTTAVAAKDTVRLERVDEHQMRSVTDLSLDASGLAFQLRDGDILELVSIVDRYKNGVTLRGNVANPGHYSWHEGMRVADLFPNKDALITRDYWLKQGQLGKPILTYAPFCPPHPRNQTNEQWNSPFAANGAYPANPQQQAMNGTPAGSRYEQYPDARPDVADNQTEEELDPSGCVPESEENGLPPHFQRDTSLVPASSVNPQMQQQQQYPNQNQNQAVRAATGDSAAEAMISRSNGQFQPRNDVKLSAPDIDWSYAVIERLNRETLTTSLLPFNLGNLVMEKSAADNLELQPGDVVTIFSKADIRVPQAEQTRLVHLEGEFRAAGVYSVKPGETLRDLVKRAGGFTPDAYLYGSEFTRESTRRVQQQRLNEYVNQIALQATTNSAVSANRSISALDTAAVAAASAQNDNIISNLRQARATGRIVLELKPDSSLVDQLPAIPLEDGDRFIVPQVPSTVSVTGAVYNPNAFVHDDKRRLEDYLRLAGGPDRDADANSTYVIRADGSVVSLRQISYWHKDAFKSLRIYPGDTVIVPLNLRKGTGLRTAVDIAQIVGQFGLAAAAANLVF